MRTFQLTKCNVGFQTQKVSRCIEAENIVRILPHAAFCLTYMQTDPWSQHSPVLHTSRDNKTTKSNSFLEREKHLSW